MLMFSMRRMNKEWDNFWFIEIINCTIYQVMCLYFISKQNFKLYFFSFFEYLKKILFSYFIIGINNLIKLY